MQADPPDTVQAASPPLAPFRPAPAPAPTHDHAIAAHHEGLRRRRSRSPPRSPSTSSTRTMRVHLQTPHTELGGDQSGTKTPGWDVRAGMHVSEAKDAIADGSAGYGRWERDGLRLVWRGRMLRDDEVMGTALAGAESPTMLLVARPLASRTRTAPSHALPMAHMSTAAAAHLPTTFAVSTLSTTSPEATALVDTVHYVLFMCREHLAALLGVPVLEWEWTYPTPLVSRADASAAVRSVVRAYAEPDWQWEAAFEGDGASLKGMWERLGADGVRVQIAEAWYGGMGRDYAAAGERCRIELDNIDYDLHLPPLKDMVPSQLSHLLLYLRAAALAARLSGYLSAIAMTPPPPAPEPTRTIPVPQVPPQHVRVLYRGSIHLRVPRVSLTLLTHLFWSSMRIATVLWMITRGMRWDDMRFWLLFTASLGWWCVDGYNHWIVEQREERIRAELRARRAAIETDALLPDGGPGMAQRVPGQGGETPQDRMARVAADAPLHAAAAARAGAAHIRPRQARRRQQDWNSLILYHLNVDRRQLRLPRSSLEQAPRTVASEPTPNPAPAAVRLRHAPSTRPSWWMTHVFLFVYLWVVTLIPAFEVQRARAIRRRERAMRTVMTSLNRPEGTTMPAEGGNTLDGEHGVERTPVATPPRELVFPDHISDAARAYYTRIAGTSEAIDWEEERDAQRAMGIPDEEDARPGLAGLL